MPLRDHGPCARCGGPNYTDRRLNLDTCAGCTKQLETRRANIRQAVAVAVFLAVVGALFLASYLNRNDCRTWTHPTQGWSYQQCGPSRP